MGLQLYFCSKPVMSIMSLKSRKTNNTASSSCQSSNEFFHFIHEGGKFLFEHQAPETLYIANRHKVSIISKLPLTFNICNTWNYIQVTHLGILTSISINRSASGRAEWSPLKLTSCFSCTH